VRGPLRSAARLAEVMGRGGTPARASR